MPETHLLRAIDRFVELDELRAHLAPFHSETGRPSIDPEPLIRMLMVGYCCGIRSERRLCEEIKSRRATRGRARDSQYRGMELADLPVTDIAPSAAESVSQMNRGAVEGGRPTSAVC